jgi:hypothetical protein
MLAELPNYIDEYISNTNMDHTCESGVHIH